MMEVIVGIEIGLHAIAIRLQFDCRRLGKRSSFLGWLKNELRLHFFQPIAAIRRRLEKD